MRHETRVAQQNIFDLLLFRSIAGTGDLLSKHALDIL